jgi:WD40 repeat protein
MDTQESSGESSTSNVAIDANPIEIVAQDLIYSVAFIADGKYVVSAGHGGKIRRW